MYYTYIQSHIFTNYEVQKDIRSDLECQVHLNGFIIFSSRNMLPWVFSSFQLPIPGNTTIKLK